MDTMSNVEKLLLRITELSAAELVDLMARLDLTADSIIHIVRHAADQGLDRYIAADPDFEDGNRKKIQAIKVTREVTGLPLKEAKETVEGQHPVRVGHETLAKALKQHGTGFKVISVVKTDG